MDFPEQPSPLQASSADSHPPSHLIAQKTRSKRMRMLVSYGVSMAIGLVTIIFVYAFVHRVFIESPVESEILVEGKSRAIQLVVLNGTDSPKLAQRAMDYLRARGFDVVEMGNASTKNVDLTRVIDRVGNLDAAKKVADALGVPEERIVQELDRSLYLDVSIVIGKDYGSLKPFH